MSQREAAAKKIQKAFRNKRINTPGSIKTDSMLHKEWKSMRIPSKQRFVKQDALVKAGIDPMDLMENPSMTNEDALEILKHKKKPSNKSKK